MRCLGIILTELHEKQSRLRLLQKIITSNPESGSLNQKDGINCVALQLLSPLHAFSGQVISVLCPYYVCICAIQFSSLLYSSVNEEMAVHIHFPNQQCLYSRVLIVKLKIVCRAFICPIYQKCMLSTSLQYKSSSVLNSETCLGIASCISVKRNK